MITLFRSALYMTNSAVIETPDLILIVDPCWLPDEVEAIRRHAAALPADKPRYLLFTHSDFDHIIGYGAFIPTGTEQGLEVIASQLLAEKPSTEQELILNQIREFDDEYYIERDYPTVYPSVTILVGKNGQQLVVGLTTLTFYQAPGHTDDGLMAVIKHSSEANGLLIAGDYLSDIEFPYIYHSSEAYLSTLDEAARILDRHAISALLPGHGNMTTDRDQMHSRIVDSQQYILALRAEVAQHRSTETDTFLATCRFPLHMRRYHDDNRMLIEREQHPTNP